MKEQVIGNMQNKPINLQYDNTIYKPGETRILYDNLKSGEKNLYIISTPMQLMSAIEAQNHFKTKNNVLVILFFLILDGKNINQMFDLLEYFPYDKLITYQNSEGIKIFNLIKYIKEISSIKYKNVFFGHSTPLYRRMIANVKYENLFFLDDGVLTITVHNQIYNDEILTTGLSALPIEKTGYKRKIRDFYYRLNRIKVDCTLEDIQFFTMFNLSQYQNEKIINYDFSYIRELFFNNTKNNDIIYILGQPLKRAIKMQTFAYIRYLDEVFEYYADKNIIYIPHRTEHMSDWFQYILYTKKNVTIKHLDVPIELYFLKNNIVPTIVLSFITTALFTLKKMFPFSSLKYIEIDTSQYTKHHQENIQLIYNNYQKDNIEKFNGLND